MFSRLQRRRSNLQDLGRLSKSCPAVDSPVHCDDGSDSDSGSSSASLSDPVSESSEEVTPPVSRAEKHLARQSLRRARQREVEQKRNMEENKISMDDYLGKQTQFKLWLLEEQKKEVKNLSSPKRKTYFKMFVRLWNKRHLPAKFYETRLSRHMDDEEGVAEDGSPAHPNRPKFSLMQNSPALDPTIFPHTIDLSSDSITLAAPSPFSTFGKSTPSTAVTPIRFSADCGKASPKSVVRDKGVFRFGENKENTTHFSMPAVATAVEHLRTATISPRKKMISACQGRSLDRMVVSWSPRGEAKLNPVDIPRCPSPFEHNAAGKASTLPSANRTTTAVPGKSGDVCTLPRLQQHHHHVKDFMSSVSPTYAEIPFIDGSYDGQAWAASPGRQGARFADSASAHNAFRSDCDSVKPVAKPPGVRSHRRRSRSVDEMAVYAVPDKQSREKHWSENQAVSEEDLSTSTPPLPPKLFDPHVEGLGVPFSAPNSREDASTKAESSLPQSRETDLDDPASEEETSKKSSKKMFKGKLPWFGKRLTSRRRSRSYDVLSPLPHSSNTTSRDVAPKEDSCDQFPLVKLEHSPTLSRRVLTRPHKVPDKQAGISQENKLELMEYASSPMRVGFAGTPATHHAPLDRLTRGKSLRRRSRSLEQISSPFLDSFHHSEEAGVSHQETLSGQRHFLQSFARAGTLPSPRSGEKSAAGVRPSTGSSMPATTLRHGYPPEAPKSDQAPELGPKAHCDVYEQVKSDVKKELSSLVSKIQQLSAPETAAASQNENISMEVEELESSPKRFGPTQDSEQASTGEPARGTGTPSEDLGRDGSVSCPQSSNVISFPESLPVAHTISKVQDSALSSKTHEFHSHATGYPMPPVEGRARDQVTEMITQTSEVPSRFETNMLPAMSQDSAFSVPLPALNEAPRKKHSEVQGLVEAGMHPATSENVGVSSCMENLPATSQDTTFPELLPSLNEASRRKRNEVQGQVGVGMHPAAENAGVSSYMETLPPTSQDTAFPMLLPTSNEAPRRKQNEVQGRVGVGMHPATKAHAAFTASQPAAPRVPANNLHEAPSHMEPVRHPAVSRDLAFSVSVPAARLVTGVCKPLSTAQSPSASPGETRTWLTPHRTRQPQRRRSRSVGEACTPRTFHAVRDTSAHTQAQFVEASSPRVVTATGNVAPACVRFTPSIPVLADGDLSSSKPPLVEDSKPLPCPQPHASGSDTPVPDPSQQVPQAVRKPPQQMTPGQPSQAMAEQQPSWQTAPVKAPPQVIEKQQPSQQTASMKAPPPVMEKQQPSQQTAPVIAQPQVMEKQQPSQQTAPMKAPPQVMEKQQPSQQTAPMKAPPQVIEKQQLQQQTTSLVSETQQSSEEDTAVPSVKAILQKFGGSFRATQRSRRRSRSVGDMSVLQDKDHGSGGSPQAGEGGGFAGVRAFWDRLRGRAGGDERPNVTLQRKPSTMRRLQQQLYGEEVGPGNSDAALSVLQKQKPSPSIPSSSQASTAVEGHEDRPHSQSQHISGNKASPTSSLQAAGAAEQHTPVSKLHEEASSEKASGKMPVQRSPFVTVRRQSSRKRNTGSPCCGSSDQSRAWTDSPNSRDPSGNQVASDPTLRDTSTATNDIGSTKLPAVEKTALNVMNNRSASAAETSNAELTAASTLQETLASGKEEQVAGVKQEASGACRQMKKKPMAPPKPLPKPTSRPLVAPQQHLAVRPECPTPSADPAGPLPFGIRTRKRRSQEMDQAAVPEKLHAASETQGRGGPVTRSASRGQMKIQEDGRVTPQSNCSLDTDRQEKERSSMDRGKTARSSAKGHSSDMTDGTGLSPEKQSNSVKEGNKLSTTSRRVSSGKETRQASPVVKRQGSLKAPDSNSRTVRRKSSGKERKVDLPMVKRRSSGKESNTDSPAMKKQSFGKEQTSRNGTPRRRSSTKVGVARNDSARRRGSIIGREQSKLSPQVHRSSSGRGRQDHPSGCGKVVSASSRETPKCHGEKSAVFLSPGMQHDGAKEDPRGSSPVKRYNSAREEAKTTSASSLVKRFNSLRDDTQSSRAKRRSRDGSQGTPVSKRISTGSGKSSRRESIKVKRTDSGRQNKGGRESAADKHGDTPSRTGSIRIHGVKRTQSPTFIRITRHLGVLDDDDRSDDSDSEDVDARLQFMQKAVLALHKTRTQSSAGSAPRLESLACTPDANNASAAGLVRDHSSSSAGHGRRQRSIEHVQMETDIDTWIDELEPNIEREPQKNSATLSTLV